MSRKSHVIWLGVLALSLIIAVVAPWSDVWEAYVSVFVALVAVYGALVWRARRH